MTNIIPVDFSKTDSEEGEQMYRIQFVALAYAYAVQLGEIKVARSLLRAINGSGFDTAVALDDETGRWLDERLEVGTALFYEEEAQEG